MVESVSNWIIHVISTLGYPGIILTMAIESALIPLPSEIIMPFSGFLAQTGRFSFILVGISGASGNLVGSLLLYWLGHWGHERLIRRLIRRFGGIFLITEKELDYTEKLIHQYKDLVVLVSRVVPGIRTVISLPCGFARLPLGRFVVLTFLGSLAWSYFLAGIGYVLGQNWHSIGPIFHKLNEVIVGLLVVAIIWYIWHKLKK